jgi:excisionase family DNA binding protein
MTEWVTQARVAELVGCSVKAVEYAVSQGEIRHRSHHGPRPTVDRDSALTWGHERRFAQTAAQARRDAMAASEPVGPPDHEDVWLNVETVGALLACSAQFVGRLAKDGRLPATRHGRRWWIRRQHAEQYAAARAFNLRRRAA